MPENLKEEDRKAIKYLAGLTGFAGASIASAFSVSAYKFLGLSAEALVSTVGLICGLVMVFYYMKFRGAASK